MMVRFSMMVRFPSSFMTLRIFTLKRATGGETAQYRDGRGRENKTLFYDGTLSFIFYDATDFYFKKGDWRRDSSVSRWTRKGEQDAFL